MLGGRIACRRKLDSPAGGYWVSPMVGRPPAGGETIDFRLQAETNRSETNRYYKILLHWVQSSPIDRKPIDRQAVTAFSKVRNHHNLLLLSSYIIHHLYHLHHHHHHHLHHHLLLPPHPPPTSMSTTTTTAKFVTLSTYAEILLRRSEWQ